LELAIDQKSSDTAICTMCGDSNGEKWYKIVLNGENFLHDELSEN
jgi:hypothetical protein